MANRLTAAYPVSKVAECRARVQKLSDAPSTEVKSKIFKQPKTDLPNTVF